MLLVTAYENYNVYRIVNKHSWNSVPQPQVGKLEQQNVQMDQFAIQHEEYNWIAPLWSDDLELFGQSCLYNGMLLHRAYTNHHFCRLKKGCLSSIEMHWKLGLSHTHIQVIQAACLCLTWIPVVQNLQVFSLFLVFPHFALPTIEWKKPIIQC